MKTFEDLVSEMNKGIEEFSTIFTKEFDNKTNKINELFDQIKKDRIQKEKDAKEHKEEKETIPKVSVDDYVRTYPTDGVMLIKVHAPGFSKENLKVTKKNFTYTVNGINGGLFEIMNINFYVNASYLLGSTELKDGVLYFTFNKKKQSEQVDEIEIS